MSSDSSSRTVSDQVTPLTIVHRFVYGNRDLTRVMAEDLGYVGRTLTVLMIVCRPWTRAE